MTSISREEVVRILAEHKKELTNLHIQYLGLFGSLARDEGGPMSDVDLLVNFSKPIGLFHLTRVQTFLEKILKQKVDLVPEDSLRKEFRDQIMKEVVRAA